MISPKMLVQALFRVRPNSGSDPFGQSVAVDKMSLREQIGQNFDSGAVSYINKLLEAFGPANSIHYFR